MPVHAGAKGNFEEHVPVGRQPADHPAHQAGRQQGGTSPRPRFIARSWSRSNQTSWQTSTGLVASVTTAALTKPTMQTTIRLATTF